LAPERQAGDAGHRDEISKDLLGNLLDDGFANGVRSSVDEIVVPSAQRDQVVLYVIGESSPVTDVVQVEMLIGPAAPAAAMSISISDGRRKCRVETLVAGHISWFCGGSA
jgi:hypothetical protein